jgi:hypothetical protein
MWFIRTGPKSPAHVRNRHVKPALEQLEARLVPAGQTSPMQQAFLFAQNVGIMEMQPGAIAAAQQAYITQAYITQLNMQAANTEAQLAAVAQSELEAALSPMRNYGQEVLADTMRMERSLADLRSLADKEVIGYIAAWENLGNLFVGAAHFGAFIPGNGLGGGLRFIPSGVGYGYSGLGLGGGFRHGYGGTNVLNDFSFGGFGGGYGGTNFFNGG